MWQVFKKQFHEVIDKLLKKALQPLTIPKISDMSQIQLRDPAKKMTLIISLDGCIVKTSVFREELSCGSRIDG